MFDLDSTERLAIQLGRPLRGWWDSYFEEPHGTGGPDALMRAEFMGFVELVRERRRRSVGGGVRTDNVCLLLANAGMLARTLGELDHVLDRIGEWYDEHSARERRRAIAAGLREMGITQVARPPRGPFERTRPGILTRLRNRMRERREPPRMPLPGSRRISVGCSQIDLSIGLDGTMRSGVVIAGVVWIIMSIDDRDDRDPRTAPAPTPELIA